MATTSLTIRVVLSAYFLVTLCFFSPNPTTALHVGEAEEEGGGVPVPVLARHGAMVKKDKRLTLVTSEFGEISAVKVGDGKDGFYHLQFITMEPNSLFLPVHLHSDMVFYVDSGSGTLNWVDLEKDDDKLRQVDLQAGDVYRLRTGSFFYLQSNLDPDRRKLRINAIFSDSKEEIREGSSFGAYASVRDLVLGFDNRVLQAALNVDEKVIEELRSGGKQAMIVHRDTKAKVNELWEVQYKIMRAFLGHMKNGMNDISNNNKKYKAYNIRTADHDVENCNGWSLVVTSKQLDVLKDSDFSIYMVNLTKGAMMGPHWNPTTAEIGVVVRGRGMVHVVCPGTLNETECKNSRFRVEEGDVFVVPRYHPMAQMSFNNGSFVFMGFTTTTKKNHPQYLVGKASVLQVLDMRVLAASFGVSNTTMDEVLKVQREAIILECASCAEEEERLMEEEIRREKEEEAKRREEEEEARRREEEEEEEAKRREEEARRKEEEAARRREEEEEIQREKEEEAKRREEEEAARRREEEEEAKRREEEEAKRREEEARRKEEAAARRREEEEEAKRREEEEAKRREEEEAKRREEEEEAKRKEEEERREQEESRKREEEEEAAKRQEEEQEKEEARKQREEEEARRQQEKEEARKREEEEAARRQEEEARRRQEEEEARKRHEEEAARRQEEEAQRRREEEEARQQEEARKQQEEEAARRQQRQKEEEAKRRQEEEARRQSEEEEAAHRGGGGGHGGGGGEGEGEAASREEEEMARREREAEAAARERGGGMEAMKCKKLAKAKFTFL